MAEGASAEIGLSVGLVAAAFSYGLILLVIDRPALDIRRLPGMRPVLWEAGAAAAIVTGTWLRYLAMALIPLAIVSALGRVNILVILSIEHRSTTMRLWIGALCIIAGTVLFSLG
jgi:drug/metabolite transporter (DMT)-like permease